MPIYEYHCEKCGNFETYQGITESPLGECPDCNSQIERLIYPVMGRVKGQNLGSIGEKNYKRDKNKIIEQKDKAGVLEKEKHQQEIKKIMKMNDYQKRRYIENG